MSAENKSLDGKENGATDGNPLAEPASSRTDGPNQPVCGDSGPPGETNTAVVSISQSVLGHASAVIDDGGGTDTARLLDTDGTIVSEVDTDEVFEALRDSVDPPSIVIPDGVVNQRLLNVAAQQGVSEIVAREEGDFVRQPLGTRIRTVANSARKCEGPRRLFPPDVPAPDFLAADDFTVTYSTKTDLEAPAREQAKLLKNAESIRMPLPAIDIEPTQSVPKRIVRGDLKVKAIILPAVESIVNIEPFASLITEMVESGGLVDQPRQGSNPYSHLSIQCQHSES